MDQDQDVCLNVIQGVCFSDVNDKCVVALTGLSGDNEESLSGDNDESVSGDNVVGDNVMWTKS